MTGTETAEARIAVVGGGIAGACAAALLARHAVGRGEDVLLIEPAEPRAPLADEPLDLRVSAVSPASRRILEAADAWHRLDARRICSYERMHVWHESGAPFGGGELVFDAAEIAEPELGCIVENRRVQHALLAAFREAGGRVLRAHLRGLELRPDAAALDTDGGRIQAALVVGGDGAQSRVRELAQLASTVHDYGQRAIVAAIETDKPHAATAWQCFREGGPVALLPLADGRSSLVWSCTEPEAARLLALEPQAFVSELEGACDAVLGRMRLTGERAAFPLRGLAAERYVVERCALLGDAAHVVHPLAGQGVNLGLLDAAALCETLADARGTREDPGALRLLRRYERSRKAHNELMASAIDRFDAWFGQPAATPAARARTALAARGLSLVNRAGYARRFFARHAMGVAGELPRYARAGYRSGGR